MSKDNELEILKNIFLKNSKLTQKQLEKEISETKTQMKKELGKNAVDERGALWLLAGKHGVNLSIPSSSTTKDYFETYVDAREDIREFYK